MKRYWLNVFIIIALLLMCGAATAETDVATGEPVVTTLKAAVATPVCDIRSETCGALWDISHGVYLNYYPTGDFSSFVALLNSEGYPVAVTSDGVLAEDLSNFKILIISTLTTNDDAYTAAEVAAIQDFVNNGGKLLILAENTDCPNDHIQPVSSAFGTTVGVSYIIPGDVYITDMDPHPAFTGVSTVYLRAAGELAATSPSVTVARTDDSLPAMTSAVSNQVFVIADSNVFDNDRLTMSDNQQLAMNLWKEVYCPPVPEFPSIVLPATFIAGLVGAVLLLRRIKD